MLKFLTMAAMLGTQAAGPPPLPRPVPCVTRAEVGAFTVIGMAVTVEMVRNACRPHLADTAYLRTPAAAEFSARLRSEAHQRFDVAMAGVSRMVGGSADQAQTTAMMRGMFGLMMTEGAGADFAGSLDAEFCRDANEIVEISSALSPDQMARLMGAFASIADHFIRTGPPRLPAPAAPAAAPPAAAPAPPRPTPLAFDVQRRARRPAAPPAVTAPPPRPPIQPFLCRPSE